MPVSTSLVVGATGKTGKHVVKMLLDQGQTVKVIVRSKERMLHTLKEFNMDLDVDDRLMIIETPSSFSSMTDEQLENEVKDCQAVVSCLGHNLNWKGIYKEGPFVTETAKRLTSAVMKKGVGKTKFIMMGSDGVANPNGQDDRRSFVERSVLYLLRHLLPPHADNEGAAAYMHSLSESNDALEWTVVRPTDLIEGDDPKEYNVFEKPTGGLFGSGVATRSTVAKFMTDLINDEKLWEQWKHKMPVLYDKKEK